MTYADLSTLSALGGNDFVVDGRGNAFVNIPGYDAMTGPPPSGNTAPGFLALVAQDGMSRAVAEDLNFPNGMAVTPDNSTFVLAWSHRNRLTACDVSPDGALSGRASLADEPWACCAPGGLGVGSRSKSRWPASKRCVTCSRASGPQRSRPRTSR